MLKTISAALLAISVLAAPAMAAGTAKTRACTGDHRPPHQSVKQPSVLNANARMGRHHHSIVPASSAHAHKQIGALPRAHQFSKVIDQARHAAIKRG